MCLCKILCDYLCQIFVWGVRTESKFWFTINCMMHVQLQMPPPCDGDPIMQVSNVKEKINVWDNIQSSPSNWWHLAHSSWLCQDCTNCITCTTTSRSIGLGRKRVNYLKNTAEGKDLVQISIVSISLIFDTHHSRSNRRMIKWNLKQHFGNMPSTFRAQGLVTPPANVSGTEISSKDYS